SLAEPGTHASRALFDRIRRIALDGAPAAQALGECDAAHELAVAALGELERAVGAFKAWRELAGEDRAERERYSLLREWIEGERSAELCESHVALCSSLARLDAAIAALTELVASLRAHGAARLRRACERARTDVAETCEALVAWLPRRDGKPALARETF